MLAPQLSSAWSYSDPALGWTYRAAGFPWSKPGLSSADCVGGATFSSGALKGNAFAIVVRNVDGDRDAADALLDAIGRDGVPNFFGEQRFGRGGGNVAAAAAMFAGQRVPREERSILLSAARSAIFNAVLAARVADGSWRTGRDGDVFQLDGTGSIFGPEPLDATLRERIASGDVHPTGPLWGRGELRTTGDVAALEPKDLRRNMPRFEPANFAANLKLLDGFIAIADELQCTPAQLALAWVLSRGEHVLAIPGTTKLAHLRKNAAGADIGLSASTLARLDALINQRTVAGPRYDAAAQAGVDTEEF